MTFVRKDLLMGLSAKMHLLEDVPIFLHMTMQRKSANIIKNILVLSGKANSDDISVSVKHIPSLLRLTVNTSCCKTVT